MTLTPLADASLMIQIHTAFAVAAAALTLAIFSLRKGSRHHRIMGWMWVTMMATVAVSSFWISTIKLIGPFSPIHLLSIFVLLQLVGSVRAARSGRITDHKRYMQGMSIGALAITGALTLFPGRIMHAVVLGG